MDYNQIKDLIKTIEESNITSFNLQFDDVSIKMRKDGYSRQKGHIGKPPGPVYPMPQPGHMGEPPGAVYPAAGLGHIGEIPGAMNPAANLGPYGTVAGSNVSGGQPGAVGPTTGPGPATAAASEKIVEAPVVGTFYTGPGPESPAFVKTGDIVKKGDVLCIIEAMKVMNEINSSWDGTIISVLAENGAMVEYGQPLFRISITV